MDNPLVKSTVLIPAILMLAFVAACKREELPPEAYEKIEHRYLKLREIGGRRDKEYSRDVTGWEEGENFVNLVYIGPEGSRYVAQYGYPWQGEDELNYKGGTGLLYVNGELCGVDLRHVRASQVSNKEKIITAIVDSFHVDELFLFPNLIAVKAVDVLDHHLAQMGKLHRLHYLDLNQSLRLLFTGNRTTDAGLKHLRFLTELRYLDLTDSETTEKGLEYLEDMSKLRVLLLYKTWIDNEGLALLANFPELRVLSWSSLELHADKGLSYLRTTPKLEKLYLSRAQISDRGIRYLKELPNLRVLDLSGNDEITNIGAMQLKGIYTLEVLDLEKTRLTPQALVKLKQALPRLEYLAPAAGR